MGRLRWPPESSWGSCRSLGAREVALLQQRQLWRQLLLNGRVWDESGLRGVGDGVNGFKGVRSWKMSCTCMRYGADRAPLQVELLALEQDAPRSRRLEMARTRPTVDLPEPLSPTRRRRCPRRARTRRRRRHARRGDAPPVSASCCPAPGSAWKGLDAQHPSRGPLAAFVTHSRPPRTRAVLGVLRARVSQHATRWLRSPGAHVAKAGRSPADVHRVPQRGAKGTPRERTHVGGTRGCPSARASAGEGGNDCQQPTAVGMSRLGVEPPRGPTSTIRPGT